MKVLIMGGTGTISTFIVQKCIDMHMDVTVMNRGSHNEKLSKSVHVLIADINNEAAVNEKLKDHYYDCIIDFIAFTKKDVARDVRLFKGKTDQYIFISSASAYQKPVVDYPITEETPLVNPYWMYSQHKADCETYLKGIKDFNVTIVRPSHTYDNRMIMSVMTRWGYEYAHIIRLLTGKPIIIPGDGTSVWTITHASDFANSFVHLIGNSKAYGEAYHITGEKLYTWEQLTTIMADALGVKAHVIHIPTDVIVRHMPEMEGPLLGDKAWSAIFDNTKIKAISQSYTSYIGYEDVIDDVIAYYNAHEELQKVSDSYEAMYDELITSYLK